MFIWLLKRKKKQLISEKSALRKYSKLVLAPTEENSFDLESVNIAGYWQICNCVYLAFKTEEGTSSK